MEQLIKQMMEQMNQHFEKTNVQFEKIDKRFENIEHRLDSMDLRLDSMDQQFVDVNQQLDRVEGRILSRILSLKETVENNATEFRSHFRHIENKLEEHDKMFELVSTEMRRRN